MGTGFKKIFSVFSRRSNGVGNVDAGLNGSTGSASASKQVDGGTEVWLYPDSDELNNQTALKPCKIEQSVFRLGRRVSDSITYPDDDPPEVLIFEKSPFTVSRLHCQIELKGNKAILRDMGSKVGTHLDDKKLKSDSRKPSSVVLPKGTHTLILGNREGPFRFRLVVS